MPIWGYALVCAAYCVIFGILTTSLAENKGYEGYFWTGFLLGVFGLIYVVGLPIHGDVRTRAHEDLARRIAQELKR